MVEKPTLAEISEMPFPASMLAMREHYDSNWGKYREEGDLVTYEVTVRYSRTENDWRTYTIEAASKQEAERLAEDEFDNDKSVESDAEMGDIEVEEQSSC